MRVRNAFIYSTASIAALAAATPSYAQASAPVDTTPEKTAEGEQLPPSSEPTNAEGQPAAEATPTESGGAIVVTGSRIRRDNFSTPQNIDVITRDDQVLAGARSTTDVLQSGSVTSGTSQISGSFLGFLSDNGQGANTVGLRGLGASRTLVLLNGRRLAPAGVGAQLIAADLNTLPTSVVQRIEILREGASSIYGSDAIAGVINVITDTEVDGITLDGYADIPEIGAGRTLRGSVTAGKTFDRGHIMASFEYREDKGLEYGSRKDTRCQRELAFINGGQEVGQTRPFSNELRCYPFARGGYGSAAGYALGTGYILNGGSGPTRITFPGYATGNPDIFGAPVGVASSATDFNLRPETPSSVLDTTFLTPLKTYTAYVNGSYELQALGDAELYGEGLFVRRKTKQHGLDRADWLSTSASIQNYGPDLYDVGDNILQDYYPSIVSPFFPVSWRNAGVIVTNPLWIPDFLPQTKQKVDFWRANFGVRGNLGIGDWRYDANAQFSRTKGRDDRQTNITENVANTLIAVAAPAGTPEQYITRAIAGQLAGAGAAFTCASNVTNGAYNGGTCQPVNAFDPAVMLNGQITDAQKAYLYPWINYTKTKFRQKTFAVGFDGSLFALPGGEVKGAVGFEYRSDRIDDRPGEERVAGTLYRYGTAARTKGSDNVKEAYAELNLPFFRDRPFLDLLELDVSGRYTDYKSYGSGWTYHAGAQWAPVKQVRFRGNYGTNFRAPNLYEQFVADQVGFYASSQDPCANFVGNSSPGQPLYDNCLTELTAALGSQAAALAYAPNGSFQVTTTGGAGIIKAEKAKTWGAGVVFTMPSRIADFSLAIDYFNINVKGEVGTLGNLILDFCYNADDYPNNPYCALIGPRYTPANAPTPVSAGNIINLSDPYLNIARQLSAGLDFDARFATNVLGGKFTTQLQATRMMTQKIEFFPGDGLNNYNGELGYPGFGSGPKWTGSLDTRFKTANDITFRWGMQFVGKMNSQADANVIFLDETGTTCVEGAPGCFEATFDARTGNYLMHSASVQWLWKNVGQFTIGVNNIFDKDPPIISDDALNAYPRFGNFFANGAYDYRGRSFFVNVTRTFK